MGKPVRLLDREAGELEPLLVALQKILHRESEIARQQWVIELLVASHAMRFNDAKLAMSTIETIDKHVRQLVIGAITDGSFPKLVPGGRGGPVGGSERGHHARPTVSGS